MFYSMTTLVEVWLNVGIKTTWLALGKYHGLDLNGGKTLRLETGSKQRSPVLFLPYLLISTFTQPASFEYVNLSLYIDVSGSVTSISDILGVV